MPNQPHIQWVLGELSIQVKHHGYEDDHTPRLVQRVKMSGAMHLLPHMSSVQAQRQP